MPVKYKYRVMFTNSLIAPGMVTKACEELNAWGRKGKYELADNDTILLKSDDEVDVITETFKKGSYHFMDTPENIKDKNSIVNLHPLAIEIVILKNKLAQEGLYKTLNVISKAEGIIGWEVAEKLKV